MRMKTAGQGWLKRQWLAAITAMGLTLMGGMARGDRAMDIQTGGNITQFFMTPGDAVTLQFAAPGQADGREFRYEILDYTGTPTGKAGTVAVKNGKIVITDSFPAGFYDICFPNEKLTFGLASIPPFTGEVDPFYAIEGLISSRSNQSDLVSLMVRGGIHFNREWCNYVALEPVQGTIKTTKDAFYSMAGTLGFKSIFCFADFPEWYYEGVGKVGRRPPIRRLLGLDESIVTLLDRRQAGLMAFHVLNEYDAYQIPGEAYVPTIKVAGYAMRDSELPLVGAPFCTGGGSASLRSSIDNGLLDFIDIFAFHSYSNPEVMIRQIREYRDAMSVHPKGGMPVWITESGKPWSRGLSPEQIKTTYGGPLGVLHPPADQDMTSAMWIAMRAVEAKAGGLAKHFAFTLPFFQENNNNFGMLDYHCTPLRSLMAYMYSIQELAGKEYLGDWKVKPDGVKILRVFGDKSGNLTAVIYTGNTEECTIALEGIPCRSVRSIDGRNLPVTQDGNVTFPGGIAYVTLEPDTVKTSVLDTETEAMELLKLAKAYSPVKRMNSPVIYQFNTWLYPKMDRKTYFDTSNVFSANVFNLSREPVTIAPRLIMPEGMKIAENPASNEITLAPRSERELSWKLDKSECPVAQYDIRLTDDRHPFSGVSVPFLNYTGLRIETFDFMNPERWRHNSSGKSTFTFDEAEKAVKVSTVFDFEYGKNESGGINYWVFPEYVLDLPKESLVGAVAFSLELKFKQDNGSSDISAPLVMFAYQDENEKGKYDSVSYGTPTDQWQEFTVSIDPEKVSRYKMIRIGMCPTASHVDYWMRNIRLHFGQMTEKQ